MVNKKGKGAKAKGSKPPAKKPQQEHNKDLHQQSPQERVALVRPFWETLGQEEREKLLSIDIESVRARAKQLAEAARQQAVADAPEGEPLDPALLELEPSIEDVLEEGVKRLKEKGTWKLWQWPPDNAALYDAESFRQQITEKHIREELRRLLPRDDGRALEKPAEAAFRQRMLDLLSKVQQSTSGNSLRPTVVGVNGEDGATRPYRRRGDPGSHLRDANIELLSVLLEALAKENDHLYHSLLAPITTYVMEILLEGHRETTRHELSFEDLENLLPDDVSRIVEWFTEKVDALSTKLKPEPKEDEEEEEENMGDVDLWSLNDDSSMITVNSKWLQHLQDRLLGEDGHPRRAKPGEDTGRNGLVLEWVYGSIVSTAEKARDGAKRCLGMQPPTAADAHVLLIRALEEHLLWETRAKQCKDLLSEMLKSRLEAVELMRQGYDLRPMPKRDLQGVGGDGLQASTAQLQVEDASASGPCVSAGTESKSPPDDVILFMLRREALLTRAKLHFLVFEHFSQEKELRILKQALRQGEPEFERLKRELDEVKHQPRCMEGAYRSSAEMERHRHQLELQTAFREQGARLQATYDKKQKAEYDVAKRETEIKQLQGWKSTVENLVDKFQELITCRNERILAAASDGAEGGVFKEMTDAEGDLEAASGALTPQQYIQLTKMRNHFFKDVRKQLYGDADDRTFFDNLKSALKAIERRLEDSSVALQHLEMQLINVACDDPGAIIGTQLALPLLQERLDQRGLEYAAQRAKLAEDEVLRMELLAAERETAERERKKAAKAKKNEKAKSEKERLAAERQAKEAVERAARQEAERERLIRDEDERRKRIEAVEAMRKAEEVAMEMRRKELLSDENGYWRQRMIMEERLFGMATGAAGSDRNGATVALSPKLSEDLERLRFSSPEEVRQIGVKIVEHHRLLHKDIRDQDEVVASPDPEPVVGSSGRTHMRSSSRDCMRPQDGAMQRERGVQHHQHAPHDRDATRHQGPAGALLHRSGSRESGSKQVAHSSGDGQVQRLPSAQPKASAPMVGPAHCSCVVTSALEIVEVRELAAASTSEPIATAPLTLATIEAPEQPEAPTATTQSPAPAKSQEIEAVAPPSEPSGALSSPTSASVPEDAILFGDIAVIPMTTAMGPLSTQTAAALQVLMPNPVPVVEPVSTPQSSSEVRLDTLPSSQLPVQLVLQAPQQSQQQLQPAGPNIACPLHSQQPAAAPAQQSQEQGCGPAMSPGQHGQGPAPLGTLPTGQVVHSIGHLPPGSRPGALTGIVPSLIPHMAVSGPPGPVPGPPLPPYIHMNGTMPVPIPGPGGPMGVAIGVGMPKQMPPPGAILMSLAAPLGARTPGLGMQAGPPPPPGMTCPPQPPQPSMQGSTQPPPPPPQQQQQSGAPIVRPTRSMPGIPGGLVHVPHPQGPAQTQHGQPPGVPHGTGPRGALGPQGHQPVMIAPMQFTGPVPCGMPVLHGQTPNGPMGHVPPHVYVFPSGAPGIVSPPGAPAQLQPQPHPHMLQMLPPGMSMQMGPPQQLHMQPQPQQLPQEQAAEQGAPAVAPPGFQPPPPPKSPSASVAGSKPSSTLNVNARSFVPSGRVMTSASTGGGPSSGGAGQPVQTHPPSGAPGASTATTQLPQHPQHQHVGQRPYQRQGSGHTEVSSGASTTQHHNHAQPGSYPRMGSLGTFGHGQPPTLVVGQYAGRRDRRDGPRGGHSAGSAGIRKTPGPGSVGPHGGMPSLLEVGVGQLMVQHPQGLAQPAVPIFGRAGPVIVLMGPAGPMEVPCHAQHVAHIPSMESGDGGVSVSPAPQVPSSSAEDGGQAQADSPSPSAPIVIPTGGHEGLLPPPGHGSGLGRGPGPQQPDLPLPHPGMAPPSGRVVLAWTPGMSDTVQVRMPQPILQMGPMVMPMHMYQEGGDPSNEPNDEIVQKNEPAAESVRASQLAQPNAATVTAVADRGGSSSGEDSAAAASATALKIQTMSSGLAPSSDLLPDSDFQLAAAMQQAPNHNSERQAGPLESGNGERSHDTQQGAPDVMVPQAVETLCRKSVVETRCVEAVPASALAVGFQQRQPQRVAGGSPSLLSGRAAVPPSVVPGQSLTPSWSSVAARREGTATSCTMSQPLDPFPSLVPIAAPLNSPSGSDGPLPQTMGQAHPICSWKAKLQRNAPVAGSLASSVAGASGHKSPISVPNGVTGGCSPSATNRGASTASTMNGSASLASSLSDSAIASSSSGGSSSSGSSAVAAAPALTQQSGNPPTGSALMSGTLTQLNGTLSLPGSGSNAGIIFHPGVGGQPRTLQLVRGLLNLGGQHNCFLNVIIQSLWHLHSFRDAVLQLNMDEVAARGAAAADVMVLRALVDVFHRLAVPLSPPQGVQMSTSAPRSWVVSPLDLREALSVLNTGQAVVRLDLSEMHDAFEVLLVLLTCMHRAEAGSGASQGQDPQLPRRVRVRDISIPQAPNGAIANGHHQVSPQVGGPTGYAAAVARKASKAAASTNSGAPAIAYTAALSLFGLEVQVPCAVEEDIISCSSNGSGAGSISKDRQQQPHNRLRRESTGSVVAAVESASNPLSSVACMTAMGPHIHADRRHSAEDLSEAEVEVYTKYFHLVHAQALRKAFAALDGSDSGAYFEDVLCAAEAAGAGTAGRPLVLPVLTGRRLSAVVTNGHGHSHGWSPGATAAAHPLATLLRFPTIFTLALVWESIQAPPDAVRGTLEALGTHVDLALLFHYAGSARAQSAATLCDLRSVICYFGHHYLVFALSEELGLWLMIDDANIQLVGHWGDVVKTMCAKRLQPSLLFYEVVAARGRQLQSQAA